jgi:Inner membrane component of T3SS, cytoplasmic domain
MYRLLILNGKFKGKRLTIQQGSVLIGRDPECQIDLDDDDEVSRHHAVIEIRGGSPVLRDLGAKNPAEVNQQPVKEHRLRNGDRIEIGRTVMEFQTAASSSPPRHRRRFSKMQATAFASIGLIVLLQVVFVIFFPLWVKRDTVQVVVPRKSKSAPVVTTNTTPAEITPETFVGPKPEEQTPLKTEEPAIMGPEQPEESVTSIVSQAVEVARVAAPEPTLEPAPELEPEVVLPPAMPAPAVTSVHPQAKEVELLRSEIENLRKQVEDIATEQIAVPPTDAPVPRTIPTDPLVAKAREMMADVKKEIARSNYPQADNILERIQMMAPDFVPAWRERALLFEKRGMLKQAGDQWQEVMTLSMGTPLYKEAAAERQRIARLEITQKTAAKPKLARETTSTQRLEKRIRITGIERERFQANGEFDEMRLLRITLRPRNNEGEVDSDELLVQVAFYDRIVGTEKIVPTRALVPQDGVRISGSWDAGEARSVTAAYILKKGFRAEEHANIGEKRDYEGYRVMVYYKGELQDESAMPGRILQLDPPEPPDSSL